MTLHSLKLEASAGHRCSLGNLTLTPATDVLTVAVGLYHWSRNLVCFDENVCRGHSAGKLTALRHALTVGFANRLARRLDRHNGYKTLGPAPVCPSFCLMSK
jgi:hypothetical protein